MTAKNIVLIGFMGSGKSAVSRRLAELTGRKIYSTDEIIESNEGCKISEIFANNGEAYFRGKEREVVKALAGSSELIVDCGGGVVIDQSNIDDLKKNGILFYLHASPEFLFKMVKVNKDRPLMQVADPLSQIKNMLKARENFYQQADYVVISENQTIEQVSRKIMEVVNNE